MSLLTTEEIRVRATAQDRRQDLSDLNNRADELLAATPSQELTRLLLGDSTERDRLHSPWRRLVASETFRHRPGLTATERSARFYEWLRLVNDTIGRPELLASDPSLLASLHEWASIVDDGGGLCTVASIHYNLFLGSLLDHENAGQRDLSDFTSMRRVGTFLCTEFAHGNDSFALETVAEFDEETGGFDLHTPHGGARKFMPNTSLVGGPKTAVVAARLLVRGADQGVFLFLTPLSDEQGLLPGVQVRPLPTRTGAPVDHCLTSFDHVTLPRDALLEAEHGRLDGDGNLTSTFGNRRKRFLHSIARVTVGKLCMSGAAVGASRAALGIAVRHGQHRRVSGPRPGQQVAVNAYTTHHGRLLEALSTAYGMTFLHRSVTARWQQRTDDADTAELEREIAIAKGWITWQARGIAAESRERCGAQGLFAVNALSGFPDYIEGTVTAEGDNLVIWTKAAAELVMAGTPGQGPAVPRTDAEALTDIRFLRDLLSGSEALWQSRARLALRGGPARDPLSRWNAASPSALTMVSVRAVRTAADAFVEATARAIDPAARELLDWLCVLFLLKQLGPYTGDLLAHGLMSPEQILALPSVLDRVTAELAPHMMTLVEAFDLPEEYLSGVPIANGDSFPLGEYLDKAAATG
jgi:acyl-CoA oxidase